MPLPRPAFAARRKVKGYTQETLAHALHVSAVTVASWEQGISLPKPERRPQLAEILGVNGDELEALLNGAPESSSNGNGYVAGWLGLWTGMEQAAGELRAYEPLIVPTLLQTEAYARALEAGHWTQVTAEAVESRVAGRMARQGVLDRQPDPLRLIVVIGESALHRRIGPPQVMSDQLDHLAVMAERSTIDVHIVTHRQGPNGVATGPFQLVANRGAVGPHVACAEQLTRMDYHETADQVASYVEVFRHLYDRALSADDSIEFIRQTSTNTWKES